jgi:hypothetical protein
MLAAAPWPIGDLCLQGFVAEESVGLEKLGSRTPGVAVEVELAVDDLIVGVIIV